jgi:hypothetical protein
MKDLIQIKISKTKAGMITWEIRAKNRLVIEGDEYENIYAALDAAIKETEEYLKENQ